MEDLTQINPTILEAATNTPKDFEKAQKEISAVANQQKIMEAMQRYKEAHTPIIREHKKIGRNDPCPCGSGKKYKNCCMASGTYDHYGFMNLKK